jgi:hypothetical protein
MNDNQRKNVRSTPTTTTTSSNTKNTSKTTDTMAPTTSSAPDKLSATSSVPNDDSGQVVAGATFPCSGCNHRQRPETSFYRDANGNPYKRCIKCTDRRRKGGKGKGAVAAATNDEYASMFLQTTHLSRALTVVATSHRVVAKPAASTKKAGGTQGAKTTDKMKPSASTVSSAATNQVVYPLLGSDDDHPQLSTDLLALISELAVVIGASSAVTIVTLTREVTKAIEEIQEELWEVRNVYAAPLGMRMPAKALGRMVAPLLNSVRTVLRAELQKTLPLRRQPGGLGTGRKAWVNLIARSLAKRLTDQLVAAAAAEAPAGNYVPRSC